jgi:hypothetical protein
MDHNAPAHINSVTPYFFPLDLSIVSLKKESQLGLPTQAISHKRPEKDS